MLEFSIKILKFKNNHRVDKVKGSFTKGEYDKTSARKRFLPEFRLVSINIFALLCLNYANYDWSKFSCTQTFNLLTYLIMKVKCIFGCGIISITNPSSHALTNPDPSVSSHLAVAAEA